MFKDFFTVNVFNCARCGEDHENIEFYKFSAAEEATKYSHWGMCPTNQEPILLSIQDKEITEEK